MFQRLSVVLVGLCLVGSAAAQSRPIQWISNQGQGVAQARRTGLPLMFYISSGSRGNRGDIKRQQQRAFRDPRVSMIAHERFVPVRLPNSNQTDDILRSMGAQVGGDQLVFATPDGKYLGNVPPGQSRDPKSLADEMTKVFRKYRKQLFEAQIKPKLESPTARPADIIKALKVINKFVITESDQSVVKLLERERLSKTVVKNVYATLAELSTPASVKALLDAAVNDKQAAMALAKCTPGGAAEMLSELELESDRLIVAYEAVTKICRIRNKKNRGFWSGQNQQLLSDELERVKAEVERVAKSWEEKKGRYR